MIASVTLLALPLSLAIGDFHGPPASGELPVVNNPNLLVSFCDAVSSQSSEACTAQLFASSDPITSGLPGSGARHSWAMQKAAAKCAQRFDRQSAEIQAILAVTGSKPSDMIPYAATSYQIIHPEESNLNWQKDEQGHKYRLVYTREQREAARDSAERNMKAAASMGVALEKVNNWVRAVSAFMHPLFGGGALVREGVSKEIGEDAKRGEDRVKEATDKAGRDAYNNPGSQGHKASCRAGEGDSTCTSPDGSKHALGDLDGAPIEVISSHPDNSGIMPGTAIATPDPLSFERKTALQKCIEQETKNVLDDIGVMLTVQDAHPETEEEKKIRAEGLLRWGACDVGYYGKEECDRWKQDLHTTGLDPLEVEERKKQRADLLERFPTACGLTDTPEDRLFCEGMKQELLKRYAFDAFDQEMVESAFKPKTGPGSGGPTRPFDEDLLDSVKQVAAEIKKGGKPNSVPAGRPLFTPKYTPKPLGSKPGSLPNPVPDPPIPPHIHVPRPGAPPSVPPRLSPGGSPHHIPGAIPRNEPHHLAPNDVDMPNVAFSGARPGVDVKSIPRVPSSGSHDEL